MIAKKSVSLPVTRLSLGLLLTFATQTSVAAAPALTATPPIAAAAPATMRSVTTADIKAVSTLNTRYQKAKSVTMNVDKTLKLGLLGQERKAKGQLWLAGGQLRMELEGAEKSLLVVGKKNLWAVTFPSGDFKDAAVQVIQGETSSKKAQSQAMVGLLGQGGFLKNFKPTGVQEFASGERVYFLQPDKDQADFKRAQLKVSADGKQITEVRYWDDRDNETQLTFSNIVFDKKVDSKQFTYVPPANADIMKL